METYEELYRSADTEVLMEITPGLHRHKYMLNRAGHLIAFFPVGGPAIVFSKPKRLFSKARRQFTTLKPFLETPDSKYNTTATHCTCKGFQFRKTCKHVKEMTA